MGFNSGFKGFMPLLLHWCLLETYCDFTVNYQLIRVSYHAAVFFHYIIDHSVQNMRFPSRSAYQMHQTESQQYYLGTDLHLISAVKEICHFRITEVSGRLPETKLSGNRGKLLERNNVSSDRQPRFVGLFYMTCKSTILDTCRTRHTKSHGQLRCILIF